MHPVLMRYLDVRQAWDALDRAGRGLPPTEEERHFLAAVQGQPETARALTEARGRTRLPEAAQQALLALASHAALHAVAEDAGLGPPLARAREALLSAGASAEDAAAYLAALVAEEGFGDEGDPDVFDAPFLLESLESLPTLAALTPDTVEALVQAWVASAAVARPLASRAAQTLLGMAWGDGPEPLGTEHVRAALDELQSPEERAALAALLEYLGARGLLGPSRLGRLLRVLPRRA